MKAAKILGFAIVTIIAASAQAIVRVPGSFHPSQCGPQVYTGNTAEIVDIAEVCVGEMVPAVSDESMHSQPAVAFRLEDGSQKIFRVKSSANLLQALRSGNIKSMFYLVGEEGEQATMKVIQTREGHIESVSGTLNGVGYFVPELATIYSIM